MKLATRIACTLLMMAGTSAAADTSLLQINGDLMVHPTQMSGFFGLAADKIKNSTAWDWPEVRFTKPYKTAWSQVQARGPFDVSFSTENLQAQEMAFELNWADPSLSIGQFEIHDTITRDIGGVHVIINLNGQCTGMSMNIPQGQWKVKGRLTWGWGASGIEVAWKDFQFTRNEAAVAQSDLGQCVGPSGLQPALQQAFEAISKDSTWLQEVLRDGILDWVRSSLGSLQGELLKARAINLKPGLDLTWEPETISGLTGGMVRVAGHFAMKRETFGKFEQKLDRSYSESALEQVKESGFVLPKDSLQQLMTFLFKTGDLQYRVTSDKIDSFASLMQSRFLQFFVWPDLMNFAKSTVFYFDLATSQAPVLSSGHMLDEGGVQYNVQAPLVVHQWAPADGKYVPYVDFNANMSGTMEAVVKNQKLTLQMYPSGLRAGALFRDEFAAIRRVNAWIATSLLGSRVQNYLGSTPFSVDIPAWAVGDGMTLEIRDVQQWKQSFRVPLQFKNSK